MLPVSAFLRQVCENSWETWAYVGRYQLAVSRTFFSWSV